MFALHAPPACGVPARRKQAKSRQQAPFAVRAPAVASARSSGVVAAAVTKAPSVDIAAWNTAQRDARLDVLEAQAMAVLKQAVSSFKSPAFPCALIAGDVVILHLLHRLGYLSLGKVKVIFIDTLHLFPETLAFMARCEKAYGFKSHKFHADGFPTRAAFDAKYGADFWKKDIEEYDRICKVEPFSRSLKTLAVDCMLNGRRRDHGFERAHLEAFEAGTPAKCQPLAYWEFRDCFAYLERHKVEAHPLHASGYPSIGDAHSTVPVPKDKWFEYAGERSGRFQGLTTKEGKPKTECGIHVDGSTRTFERDLWPPSTGVVELSVEQYQKGALAGSDALVVVYAPWCPFCQKMEDSLTQVAAAAAKQGLKVAKLRGDTVRDFVRDNLATTSFPTILAFSKAGNGRKFVKHATENRSPEDLLAFVNSACGTQRTLPAKAQKKEAAARPPPPPSPPPPSGAAPKKLNPYMQFCAEQRKKGPVTVAELGARWRALSEAEKKRFASAP